MACNCGKSAPSFVVDPNRAPRGKWAVIYPHGAVRPFLSESEARSFIARRPDGDRYVLVDPTGTAM